MEVKTSEGLCSEAVISKLTDASLYTVGESDTECFLRFLTHDLFLKKSK